MALKAENDDAHGLVPFPTDLWSDDSDFVGGEDSKRRFEAEAVAFDPREYWDVHEQNFECIIAQEAARSRTGSTGVKRKQSFINQKNSSPKNKKVKTEDRHPRLSEASTMNGSPSPSPAKSPFNPYEDFESAYQLHETLDDFIKRLRPSTTTITAGPWIFIANPFAQRRHTFDDIGGFKQEGFRLLEEYLEKKQEVEDRNEGKAPSVITRKLKPDRDRLENDIVTLAKTKNVTCGKWMLFPTSEDVDRIWRTVARGTLGGTLGCSAKVATHDPNDKRPERLICVYTDDFTDKTDVEQVLLEMKNIGLPVHGSDGRGIYYKSDAYTYLDIKSGNEYKLRASMYSSNDFLGDMNGKRRKS